MSRPLRVLVVEDSPDDMELMLLELRRGGFDPSAERVETAEEMRAALGQRPWEVILSDYTLPGFDALTALGLLQQTGLDVPFLVVSGTIGEELAVQVMKAGADDYLLKGSLLRLAPAVERALREAAGRRAREEAEQEAYRLAAIVQSSEDAIVGKTLDGTITSWNPAAERLYGWTREEAVGRSVALLVPPDRSGELSAILEKLRNGEQVEHFETVRARKDGTRVDVCVTISPVKDAAGQVTGASAIAHDITGRKAMEEALRQSEERYRLLAEAVPHMVWISRTDGFTEYANLRWTDYSGLPAEGVRGWGWLQLLHPDDVDRSRRVWESAVRAGGSYENEYRIRRADGAYRWHLARGVPLRGPDGRMEKWVGTCTDIDDQKRAEEQKQQLSRHIRLLLESTGEGIYGLDAHARCTFINRAGASMLGYTPEEVAGQDMHALVHHTRADGSPHPMRECPICSAFREGKGMRVEDDVLWRKDGTPFPVAYTSYPVEEEGFRGAVVSFNDITQRKRLEEQYRQAQKMEAFGQLAGGVAHDFNNLLTIINGYSDLFLMKLRPEDPGRELLAEIRKAGERSASLTRQLLAFSRKQVVAPRVLDLNAVVSDMERMLARIIGEDIQLAVALQPGLGSIKADPGQVEQVLLNLVVNARDAMPQGGKLTVTTADVSLGAGHPEAAPGPYVLLAVTDTGCGMSPDVQARIFEPFFTTKGPGKGTGLGLATVYGVVRQAGGHIQVQSEPGRGTTFRLYFPRGDERGGRRSSHHGQRSAAGGSETVLLVEDEDAVRALTRHVLQHNGYAVLEAGDGGEALGACERHRDRIHLLVTDVVMPGGLGGRQLAEKVRALHPETRVLYVSGYTDDAVLRHGVGQDEVAFLQKPFSPASLAEKVREVLDGP